MTRARRVGAAGFTLLELTAALFVLGAGLFGTIQMYNVLGGKLIHVQETELASRAVNTEIETLRSRPFSQLTERESAPFLSRPSGVENLVNVDARVWIKPYGDGRLDLKEVTATMRWTGEHGRTLEKSITTLVAGKEAHQ